LTVPGLGDLWAQTKGDPRVVIAVLDGPVDQTHVSFTGASLTVIEIAAAVSPRPGGDATAHGTLAASLIFGQHGVESLVAGIAPDCRGMIVPIFSDFAGAMGPNPRSGRGAGSACTQLDLARAMLIAAENGARIINVSGGQHVPQGAAHPILADAVGRCAPRHLDCGRSGQ
jgi:subtilisin family serine protease